MKTITKILLLITLFSFSSLKAQQGYVRNTDAVYKTTFYDGTLSSFNDAVAYFYPASNPCTMCTYTNSSSPSFLDGGVIFPNFYLVIRNGIVDQWSLADSTIFNSFFSRDTSKWYIDKAGIISSINSKYTIPSETGNSGKYLTTNGSTTSWSNVTPSGYLQADKGTATVSGTLLQTQYTITHGLSYTPSSVFIQAKSSNASALSFVDNITSTTFRITFLSVPIIGTNNISFNWISYR